jgi:hypothetical protein
MKLIALKKISRQIPAGLMFDISEKKARILIAMKAAKPADDEPRARRSYRRRDTVEQ